MVWEVVKFGYSSDPHRCSRYYSHQGAPYVEEKINQGDVDFLISSIAGNLFRRY